MHKDMQEETCLSKRRIINPDDVLEIEKESTF